MKKYSLLTVLLSCLLFAQETFPINGVRDQRAGAYALVNVTLHSDYQTQIEGATVLVRDGRIVAAGAGLAVPADFAELDLQGAHVYPSFIEPYGSYGLPDPPKRSGGSWGQKEQIEPLTKGAYNANDAIKAHYRAGSDFKTNGKEAEKWREAGYGTVLSFMSDGIARGTGTLVTLDDDGENEVMLLADASAHYALRKGSSKQDYPISTMGAIALLRQTMLDAAWYDGQKVKPFSDQTLDAWLSSASLPQIFEAGSWRDILRADVIAREMGVRYIVKGDGDAYQRAEALKQTGMSLIVPLNFPEAGKIEDPLLSHNISLAAMKHWELAPSNAAILAKTGIEFAFTSDGLKKKSELMDQVRKAIKRGLSEEQALKALTHTPARLLRVDDRLGSVKQGYLANLLVSDGPIFEKKSRILENWVRGKRHVIQSAEEVSLAGTYTLAIGEEQVHTLVISGRPGKYKAKLDKPKVDDGAEEKAAEKDEKKEKAKGDTLDFSTTGNLVTLLAKGDKGFRLSGWREGDQLTGQAVLENGAAMSWRATRQAGEKAGDEEADEKADEKDEDKDQVEAFGPVTYPFLAHGWTEPPTQEMLLIRNATVWTNEQDGVLQNTDVLVKDGKIAKIGKNLGAGKARIIDGTGKHLTPGIIDEHSHIALDSVNDVAVNSGMVRMADVVNSEDVNIYRNLAGGVTAAQLLHGSANPIGGQSALIKMRWGATPQEMLIEDADGFIKFALGENVKRSSNSNSIRFPLTRMGVEQVYLDAFSQASDYRAAIKRYNGLSEKERAGETAPRRDLALEAMVEILEKRRFITCHSYVQSEINMLMHVAERFDFRINTFTHILEGYKVADKMAAHGVGGSTFSDWWAYKWEVRYAIPYNTKLMHDAGVVVALNSDSSEMSRRLNQEAAKSVKYGGMTEEDALKMVTLNPAKLLHLDDRMGSVKKGKDADLVLWSDNPLSIYARVEQTMVDGIVYFDLNTYDQQLVSIEAERTRLINKILKGGKGKKKGGWKAPHNPDLHCDTLEDLHGGAL